MGGYRVIQILSVKNDTLSKALHHSYTNAVSYYYDVPGFNYQIDTCLDYETGIEMYEKTKPKN